MYKYMIRIAYAETTEICPVDQFPPQFPRNVSSLPSSIFPYIHPTQCFGHSVHKNDGGDNHVVIFNLD